MIDRTPPGQRTETTSPYLAIVGAVVIIGFGIFAFSFWPYSSTLSTDPTGKYPEEPTRDVDGAGFASAA